MTDVAHELAGQIADRGENAPGNQVAFDLGEPHFHLVQPGRVGRGKVEPDLRMIGQKGFHSLCFVSREIVHNYMDSAPGRLTGHQVGEKSHKLLAGVPVSGFPQHLTGSSV